MKYATDERDNFVSGYDLGGNLLPENAVESLIADLLASNAHDDEEIRGFIQTWLMKFAVENG